MVGDHSAPFCQLSIVCHDSAAISISSQILPGIKTERADIANATNAFAVIFSAMRLCSVLDKAQAMLAAQAKQTLHIAGMSIEMHRNNRSGFVGDAGGCVRHVNAVRVTSSFAKYYMVTASSH